MPSRMGFIKFLAIGLPTVVVGVLGVVGVWQVLPLTGNAATSRMLTKPAFRGELVITIAGNGSLEAIDSLTLSSEVERDVKILELVTEGSYVKQGDVICKLDSGEIQEKLAQQAADVAEAEAKLIEAQKSLGIQQRKNQSDIDEATLNADLAALDLVKYEQGEFKQLHNKLSGEVQLEAEELARAKESLEFNKRMARKGYRSQQELEAAMLQVRMQQFQYDAKFEELVVLEQFERKRKMAELTSKNKNMSSKKERAIEQAEIEMAKAEADFATRKAAKEAADVRLKYWQKQLEACTIKAPKDGQVLYANENRRYYGSDYEIRVGSSVYERMPIVRLPDNSALKIKSKIHESNFPRMKKGMTADVMIGAFPGANFRGEISSISAVPVEGNFPNYDQKFYEVEIRMLDAQDLAGKLSPGLSATFSIISERRTDVLQIPVQAVVTVGKDSYVFVSGPEEQTERRVVKLGISNDVNIEVLKGIEAGELVVMNPQSTFTAEIHELQQKLAPIAQEPDKAAQTPPAPKTDAPQPPAL